MVREVPYLLGSILVDWDGLKYSLDGCPFSYHWKGFFLRRIKDEHRSKIKQDNSSVQQRNEEKG